MTIYILDEGPAQCAQALDDKSLGNMIKDIAQVLCNVSWFFQQKLTMCDSCRYYLISPTKNPCTCIKNDDRYYKIPLLPKNFTDSWTKWARGCKANYLYLVELGLECSKEYALRKGLLSENYHKMDNVLEWVRDNVPDLPDTLLLTHPPQPSPRTPFPLVMPKKYNIPYIEHYSHWLDGSFSKGYMASATIESYRNYYQEKLKQKFKKCNSIFESNNEICGGSDLTYFEVKWTRQTKPEWLNF